MWNPSFLSIIILLEKKWKEDSYHLKDPDVVGRWWDWERDSDEWEKLFSLPIHSVLPLSPSHDVGCGPTVDRGQGKDRVRQGKVNCSPIHLLPAMASLLSHALHFLHSSPMAAAGFILHSHYLSHVKDLEEGRNNQLSLTYISLHYLHLSLFLVFICHFFLHHLQHLELIAREDKTQQLQRGKWQRKSYVRSRSFWSL